MFIGFLLGLVLFLFLIVWGMKKRLDKSEAEKTTVIQVLYPGTQRCGDPDTRVYDEDLNDSLPLWERYDEDPYDDNIDWTN